MKPLRGFVVLLAACLLPSFVLTACGGTRQEAPQISRSVSGPALRFADADPHDWVGIAPWHYPVHGIDVSRYQGDIDWNRVRAARISFAYIKATEGGDVVDNRFLDNWQKARQAGVPRGAYHYYYFCRTAAEQAAWFHANVPRDATALPPVLDIEWTHKSKTCPMRPDPAKVRSEMAVFLKTLTQAYGKRPVIYSTVDFYADNELWRVGGYEFWLRSVAGHPSETYPQQSWALWQYTGTGMVDGIDGLTDLNVFAGTPAQFQTWASR